MNNCLFVNNAALAAGGMYTYNSGVGAQLAQITNTKFINNSAFYYGGGFAAGGSSLVVVIHLNKGDQSDFSHTKKLSMTNNLFEGNVILSNNTVGGSAHIFDIETHISNCTFRYNSAK